MDFVVFTVYWLILQIVISDHLLVVSSNFFSCLMLFWVFAIFWVLSIDVATLFESHFGPLYFRNYSYEMECHCESEVLLLQKATKLVCFLTAARRLLKVCVSVHQKLLESSNKDEDFVHCL